MNQARNSDPRSALTVAVIGAGIVGASVALALAEEGCRVCVLDGRAAGTASSSGPAGAIVTGSVTPTANPLVIRAIPSYVFQRNSPVALRLRYSLWVIPWLTRFIAAGRIRCVLNISEALERLVSRSMTAHRALSRLAGADDLIKQVGWLKVYASEAGYQHSALERELMTRHNVDFEVLSADQIAELEPNLKRGSYLRGVFQPRSGFVSFPTRLAQSYVEAAQRRGARIVPEEVLRLHPDADRGVVVTTNRGQQRFDRVVVAAGAWSKKLVRQIGDRISLDTERGYHLSFGPGAAPLLNRPVVYPEKACVLSPMHDGLQLTSGDELAGLKAAPNFGPIRSLVPFAREVLPALCDLAIQREWMGFRPSTPDSLPVIGRSPRCRDVLYAFGHGHLGLTTSAITAQLIVDVVRDRPSRIDLTPYRVDRF